MIRRTLLVLAGVTVAGSLAANAAGFELNGGRSISLGTERVRCAEFDPDRWREPADDLEEPDVGPEELDPRELEGPEQLDRSAERDRSPGPEAPPADGPDDVDDQAEESEPETDPRPDHEGPTGSGADGDLGRPEQPTEQPDPTERSGTAEEPDDRGGNDREVTQRQPGVAVATPLLAGTRPTEEVRRWLDGDGPPPRHPCTEVGR